MEEIIMSSDNIAASVEKLRAAKTLESLFSVIRGHGEAEAARWLEGDTERSMTYAGLASRADQCAACLSVLVPREKWIALAVDTCPEWPILFWGILRSGHNALLLDTSASDSLLEGLLEEAGCNVLLSRTPRKLPASVRQMDPASALAEPSVFDYQPVWGEYVGMCTSGTTGRSRIFLYNGEALCGQALNSELVLKQNHRIIAEENRRFLAFLPFHHVMGFMANIIWGEFVGYCNLYLADRTPETLLKTCQRLQPQLLVVVPLLGNTLVKSLRRTLKKEPLWKRGLFKVSSALSLCVQMAAPEAGLRFAEKKLFASVNRKLLGTEVQCIILGGSHTPSDTLRALNALGYCTITGYGMTETAITGFEMNTGLRHRLGGSVGKALDTVEYRISGRESGARTGELQIRGDSIHTARLVHREVLPRETEDGGWYPTGDGVRMDSAGRIYIRGRIKDVIVNESGENVYPDDLEDSFA